MSTLTPEGRRLVQSLAERHGFSEEAVTRMLAAVDAGRGRMAQFSHPEFGGNGQWMTGGMVMVGDMFDNALKTRVGALCADLSDALGSDEALTKSPQDRAQTQVQTQGGDGGKRSSRGVPFFSSSSSDPWWPRELGTPSASGSQNSMRYAYFADAARLAIERDGEVRVHDTLDHRIGGFSQQQGGDGRVSMSSQHGTVDLATLPLVSGGDRAADTSPASVSPRDASPASSASSASSGDDEPARRSEPAPSSEDPLQLIERLGQLREQGLLTDEEFASKKQELLSRL